MADRTVTTRQAVMSLKFMNGDESASRNLSFDYDSTMAAAVSFALKNEFAPMLRGPYRYMFQPSSWRDYDTANDVYEISDVEMKIIQTETMYLDTSQN